ncbi:hypothetical protein PENARI_c012G04137 [Penicillium arizonense]|uniref:Apple domain-containing protein n=1 Tax=Penicillium arizonense TaxID=1835702 RepID=A0A1F5LFH7_PENAI|nr:hypothetical protein PENARI_c012G04137 [Penicillium arizonense]OGE51760.1 hypothetical protein PENARI_c012G04137 [Penicillium arizonense]
MAIFKFIPVALAATLSTAVAQSLLPNDAFSTCPTFNNKPATINGGVVQVSCDVWYSGYSPAPSAATSLRQCAEDCYASSTCQGSIWFDAAAKCYTASQLIGAPNPAIGWITLRPDRGATPPTSNCDAVNQQLQQSQNALQQCQTGAATTSQQLQQCQSSAAANTQQLQQTQNALQQCQTTAAAGAQIPSFNDCNSGGNGQVVTIGNRSMRQVCNVFMAKAHMNLLRVVHPGLTRPECAMLCALNTSCRSAYFVGHTSTVNECQLQNDNIESRVTYSNSPDVVYIPV